MVSLSTVQKTQCLKVLSGKDLLSHFLKEYCLPSVFTKCHLSQERGVELELKIQAAIKSDPANWQASSVNWSEMSFFDFYTCSHTHKSTYIHRYTHRVQGCCFPWGYSCSHLTHQFTPWQHQERSSYNLQSLRPYIALLIKPSSLQWESTESDKQHVAFLLPLHLHSLALSFSLGFALTGRCNRYLIYPSPAQHWGETRLQHCDFPMLILWSSRGWILVADALVEHWITLHNISLSFHPPCPRLTPFLSPPSPPPQKTPKSSHIATLGFQNQ